MNSGVFKEIQGISSIPITTGNLYRQQIRIMKRFSLILACLPTVIFAQTLVSTDPQSRTVLLEQYTGINCGFCPNDHLEATAILNSYPDKVVALNIHAGPFAVPQGGQIDLRSMAGDQLYNFFNPTTIQNGLVGRTAYNGAILNGRDSWLDATDNVLSQSSPVNIGLASTFNPNTRDLTVDVGIHYTDNSPGGNDRISVYLIENDISGFQADFVNGAQPSYNHRNVLRAAITGVWGDEVFVGTMGHNETRQYTFNVPLNFNINNCSVITAIGEFQSEIYQVKEVAADGGTTLIVASLQLTSSNPYTAGSAGSPSVFNLDCISSLTTPDDFTFDLNSSNAPADWTASYVVNSNSYNGPQTLNLPNGTVIPLSVQITPGSTVGVGDYRFTISSVSNPNAPILVQELHVISGVTDLIIDNPGAELYGPLYDAGLALAGQSGATRTPVSTMVNYSTAGVLTDVNNLYYNVSNTMPSFNDATVAQLSDLMDNGVNLFITGQDIGWDVASGDPNASGTPAGLDFYTNYLMAAFADDGSPLNDTILFYSGDGVYGWTPGSAVNTIFGANTYPEEILPVGSAIPVLRYNTPFKIGGIRVETTTHKVVYLGIGIEQFADAAVASEVIKRAHDWFYGAVNTPDFAGISNNLLGQAFPVPADAALTIPCDKLNEPATLLLFDATGRNVLQRKIDRGSQQIVLNTRKLAAGPYSYHLKLSNGYVTSADLFIVQH
jgi:hypothetical protein